MTIISQMAALFILILVGYGAAKLKIIDGRFSQQLSEYQQPLPDSFLGNGRHFT